MTTPYVVAVQCPCCTNNCLEVRSRYLAGWHPVMPLSSRRESVVPAQKPTRSYAHVVDDKGEMDVKQHDAETLSPRRRLCRARDRRRLSLESHSVYTARSTNITEEINSPCRPHISHRYHRIYGSSTTNGQPLSSHSITILKLA